MFKMFAVVFCNRNSAWASTVAIGDWTDEFSTEKEARDHAEKLGPCKGGYILLLGPGVSERIEA